MTNEEKWIDKCQDFLIGKSIADIRYMREDESKAMGWFHRPLVIFFEDGTHFFPSADDEGNDGGALFTSDDDLPVIPVMR